MLCKVLLGSMQWDKNTEMIHVYTCTDKLTDNQDL